MKAENLMIGDWVTSKDLKVPVKVRSIMNHYGTSIYFYHNGSEFIVRDFQIEPIPLTPEILKKNGFKKHVWYCGINNIITYEIVDNFHVEVSKNGKGFCIVDNIKDYGDHTYEANWLVDIKCVHELQHILKDFKIEKEFVL